MMSPRQTAIKNGDMFYEGRPCKRKGHTKRYVKGYGCVECTNQKARIYSYENKESQAKQQKIYEQSPEGIKKRRERRRHKKYKEKRKKKYHEDELFRVKELLRRQLHYWCKRIGSSKTGRTEELLGYTAEELKARIESLFKEGMTWDNQGEWHIDHRIPQSYFTSVNQIRECFALDNLKPEWAEWNMSKSNRFIG